MRRVGSPSGEFRLPEKIQKRSRSPQFKLLGLFFHVGFVRTSYGAVTESRGPVVARCIFPKTRENRGTENRLPKKRSEERCVQLDKRFP